MDNQESQTVTPLRLMRFGFRPNDSLQQQVRLLTNENYPRSTPLRFYASHQLLLKASDYSTYEGDLRKRQKDFQAFYGPLCLAPLFGSVALNDHTTRFGFQTTEQATFDTITSFVIEPDESFDLIHHYPHYAGEGFPNMLTDQPEHGHYLFVDIATDALVGREKRQEVESTFANMASRHELLLYVDALATVRGIRLRSPSPTS